jgi:hypothetical protein
MPAHSTKEENRAWRKKHAAELRVQSVRTRRHLKEAARRWAEFFVHYGTRCQTCGHDDISHLTIAHIGGGGGAHRKSIGTGRGTGSVAVLRNLKTLGWPRRVDLGDGKTTQIGVQCWNCNSSDARPRDWKRLVLAQLAQERLL